MSNHVHVLIRPLQQPTRLLQSLKGTTAREANLILARTGQPFWQPNVFEAPGSGEPSSRGARSRCPKGTLRFARFRSNEQSRACVDSATATAHAFAPIAERDDGEGSQRVGR